MSYYVSAHFTVYLHSDIPYLASIQRIVLRVRIFKTADLAQPNFHLRLIRIRYRISIQISRSASGGRRATCLLVSLPASISRENFRSLSRRSCCRSRCDAATRGYSHNLRRLRHCPHLVFAMARAYGPKIFRIISRVLERATNYGSIPRQSSQPLNASANAVRTAVNLWKRIRNQAPAVISAD